MKQLKHNRESEIGKIILYLQGFSRSLMIEVDYI